MDDSSNIERVILTATFFPIVVLLIVANIFADRKDLVLLCIQFVDLSIRYPTVLGAIQIIRTLFGEGSPMFRVNLLVS